MVPRANPLSNHQVLLNRHEGRITRLIIPPAEEIVYAEVRWGDICDPKSVAFWYAQFLLHRRSGIFHPKPLAETLIHEVSACLLGGYGMPSEIGWAAYTAVRKAGLLDRVPPAAEIEAVLLQPLLCRGKPVHYRFPRQKAVYLAQTLARMQNDAIPTTPQRLRDYLTTLPGVGPKTASWVVRNRFATDDVAILDVHVVRFCKALGVFPTDADPQKSYWDLERRFVGFSQALKVRASEFDNFIWYFMKTSKRVLTA